MLICVSAVYSILLLMNITLFGFISLSTYLFMKVCVLSRFWLLQMEVL